MLEHRHGVLILAGCTSSRRVLELAMHASWCWGELKLVPDALGMASAGMLSVDGRCKTLDARANGMARSEGLSCVVLQSIGVECPRLRGSAIRQDGQSASLTAPNGSAQQKLLLSALQQAALSPVDRLCRKVPR